MNSEQDGDDGFLLELERIAKGLSIGSDGPSVLELRRLFRQAEHTLGRRGSALGSAGEGE